MHVHHLNCATLCPLGGRLVNGEEPAHGRARLVCHCLLIESEAGLVLVDTGLGLLDVEGAERRGHRRSLGLFMGARLDPAETAARQIEALGFARSDVRHIVPTHLDYDHVGALADFPQAKVHVLAGEHAAAEAPRGLVERLRYRSEMWAHGVDWALHRAEGEPWFGFPCVRGLPGLPPELLLVPLIGHTRGHCGVAVETPAGWLLHAGDAYFHAGEMNPRRPWCPAGLRVFQRFIAADEGRRRENQARLRELIAEHGDRVRVFSAHDPSELERAQRGLPRLEPLDAETPEAVA